EDLVPPLLAADKSFVEPDAVIEHAQALDDLAGLFLVLTRVGEEDGFLPLRRFTRGNGSRFGAVADLPTTRHVAHERPPICPPMSSPSTVAQPMLLPRP